MMQISKVNVAPEVDRGMDGVGVEVSVREKREKRQGVRHAVGLR
jgi:hypothetical protein